MFKKVKATEGLKLVFYGDVHGLYHHPAAVAMVAKLLTGFQPDILVNGGDVIDAEAVSRFQKPVSVLTNLQADINESVRVQKKIIAAAPKAQRFMCLGNHEIRLERLLVDVPGLSSLDSLQIEELLQLNNLDVTLVDSLIVGSGIAGVELVHGHRALKHPGSSVRAMLEERGHTHSIVMGHCHRLAMISRTTHLGTIFGIEAGHLCDESKMLYMKGKTANWQHGVCFVTWTGSPLRPYFELIPIKVTNSKRASAIWRGREYKVNGNG